MDLIDQFADLVIDADDPRRLGERTIEVILSLVRGRSGAIFTLDEDRLLLFAARGLDQHALDTAQAVWSARSAAFRSGIPYYAPQAGTASGRRAQGGPARLAMVPVLHEGALAAVLYVDVAEPLFLAVADQERLQKFARIIVKAVTRTPREGASRVEAWKTYLERTPVEDIAREKLLLLLNSNEWNIARVARLMGNTRRTIYLRLQRHNIPRERVPKTRPRTVTAS